MPKPLRVSPLDSTSTLQVQAPRTQGRRQFSMTQKLDLLRAADACAYGELGVLLRKEGIYHSQLMDWRRQLAPMSDSRPSKKSTRAQKIQQTYGVNQEHRDASGDQVWQFELSGDGIVIFCGAVERS